MHGRNNTTRRRAIFYILKTSSWVNEKNNNSDRRMNAGRKKQKKKTNFICNLCAVLSNYKYNFFSLSSKQEAHTHTLFRRGVECRNLHFDHNVGGLSSKHYLFLLVTILSLPPFVYQLNLAYCLNSKTWTVMPVIDCSRSAIEIAAAYVNCVRLLRHNIP